MMESATVNYATKQAPCQVPTSYSERYERIIALESKRMQYKARRLQARDRRVRDNWINCEDMVSDDIEQDLVELFQFSREEITDYWDMTRVNWSPSDSIEQILQARDLSDARATIDSLIWATRRN